MKLDELCEEIVGVLNKKFDIDLKPENIKILAEVPPPGYRLEQYFSKMGYDDLNDNTKLMLEHIFWFGFLCFDDMLDSFNKLDLLKDIRTPMVKKTLESAIESAMMRFDELDKAINSEKKTT